MINYDLIVRMADETRKAFPGCGIEEILEAHEVQILKMPLGTEPGCMKGFLQKNSRCYTICVNSDLLLEIQAKILYHEYGHFCLGHTNGQKKCFLADRSFAYRNDMTLISRMENEANFLAAELMLDTEETLEVIHEYDIATAARILRIPLEFLDYKLRLLHQTRRLEVYRDVFAAKSDFLLNMNTDGLSMDY